MCALPCLGSMTAAFAHGALSVLLLTTALAGCGRRGAVADNDASQAAGAAGGDGAAGMTGAVGGSGGTAGSGGSEVGGLGGVPALGGADGTPDGGSTGLGGRGGTPSGGAGSASAPPGGVPWDPWPAVDAAPADTCRVSTFLGGDSSASPTLSRTELWQYDAATRVLTRRHAANAATGAWLEYVRFDGQGRREINYRSLTPTECVEWTRDPLGNSKSYFYAQLANDPFDPTTSFPDGRTGRREVTNYILGYDSAGLLISALVPFPARGGSLTFARDDRGRCSEVRWGSGGTTDEPSVRETTSHTYVNDRLAAQLTTALGDPADVRCEVTFSYDAKGTLAATVVDGYADIPQPWPIVKPPRDGVVDYVVRTVEQPDGSRWLESLDFARTTTNARVLRDGVAAPVFRWRWHLSAACGALALPRRTSQDCEYERPFNLLPLGWDNPYQTPLRLF